MNRVCLVGRLTRDPELRKTQNDTSVTSFTVAVDNRRGGQNGQNTASFIPCVAWNATADFINNYAKKGSLVSVEGRLNQRSYKNNAGANVQVVEVVVDNFEFVGPRTNSDNANNAPVDNDPLEDTFDAGDVTTDDLPF